MQGFGRPDLADEELAPLEHLAHLTWVDEPLQHGKLLVERVRFVEVASEPFLDEQLDQAPERQPADGPGRKVGVRRDHDHVIDERCAFVFLPEGFDGKSDGRVVDDAAIPVGRCLAQLGAFDGVRREEQRQRAGGDAHLRHQLELLFVREVTRAKIDDLFGADVARSVSGLPGAVLLAGQRREHHAQGDWLLLFQRGEPGERVAAMLTR